jgi:hypothetical protein
MRLVPTRQGTHLPQDSSCTNSGKAGYVHLAGVAVHDNQAAGTLIAPSSFRES